MKTYTFSPEETPVPASISAYRLILACIILLCLSFSAFARQAPPVEFKSFAISIESKKVVLTWDVSNQQSVDHYVVETSENGKDFDVAGYVFPAEDATNGTAMFWSKPRKTKSSIYYRIRSVETNGTLSYSPNREVRMK